MYRNLFVLFTTISLAGLVACGLNLWNAGKQWYFRRPNDDLGRLTARHRLRQQGLPFIVVTGLSTVAFAVLALSDAGNAPSSATGWILYGVLWLFLIASVAASADQRWFDDRIRNDLGTWDGTDRRKQ